MSPVQLLGCSGVIGWMWCLGAHLLHRWALRSSALVKQCLGCGWWWLPWSPGSLPFCCRLSLHREEPTATDHVLALPCVTQLYLPPCVSLCFLSVLRCVPCPSAVTGGFAVPLSAQGVTGLASCGVADWTRFCRSRSFDTVGEESKFVCIPSALTVAENCWPLH